MRRVIVILVLLVATLFTAAPAHAWWRHWGWRGHHHGWRHHGWGWGGWGWRGGYGYGWGRPYYAYRRWGWGYPYYGGYGGYYSYPTFYYPSYYYASPYPTWYGCYDTNTYGAGTTVGLGQPALGLYASNSVLSNRANPAIIALANARQTPVVPTFSYNAPTAFALQQFLGLKDQQPLTVDTILARVSTIEGRRKAERLIREGDDLFRVQNYHSALQRYKLAVSAAPDFPEAHWRKGHALIATHNYELASTAFKRAIALTEDLGRDGFQLNDIYDRAVMSKANHLESLAEWALTRKQSSDPYFLLGLFLNYDGQAARAEKFFQQASDLAGISGGHITVFLDPAEALPRMPTRPAATIPVVTASRTTEI